MSYMVDGTSRASRAITSRGARRRGLRVRRGGLRRRCNDLSMRLTPVKNERPQGGRPQETATASASRGQGWVMLHPKLEVGIRKSARREIAPGKVGAALTARRFRTWGRLYRAGPYRWRSGRN